MFDKEKINILSAIEAIKKIMEYTKGYSNADEFFTNQRDFDAAMMNFIIIGEMVARLSDSFMEKNKHIDWFKIRGFRNIVAHNYFGIDAEEVWQIIQNHLPRLLNDLTMIVD